MDVRHDLLRQALADGAPVTITVRGSSMTPAIPAGAEIEVRALEGPPKRGQLVVVSTGDELLVHRVVRAEGAAVLTRGDAGTLDDRPWRREQVVGRVARVRRAGRWRRPPGRLTTRAIRLLRRMLTALRRARPS